MINKYANRSKGLIFFMLLGWRIAVEDVLSNLFEVSGKDSLIACSRE